MASGLPNVHQKKLGPAPIASFEDLSEEVENVSLEFSLLNLQTEIGFLFLSLFFSPFSF